MDIILASSSPRRKKLLEKLGLSFTVVLGEDEPIPSLPPADYVKEMSRRKAEPVAAKNPNALVIGADTIVVVDGKILEKPRDEYDARQMLRSLSGRTHEVYSGVCIISRRGTETEHDVTQVTFKQLDGGDIDAYIRSGGWRDKAGAYAIQEGLSQHFIASYSGSYDTVVGLPTEKLKPMLRKRGVDIEE
jgi:septum formation protein